MSRLSPFTVETAIRFHHCDPAGIAFFARIDEILNAAFEDWCAAAGMPFPAMMLTHRQGFPLVQATMHYRRALMLGDQIAVTHSVTGVGRSSVTFALAITAAHGVCVDGTHVRVLTSLDTHRAISLPAELRLTLQSLVTS